jgi:hypothetical protein
MKLGYARVSTDEPCIVDFCRRNCKPLPESAEVNRASGKAACPVCCAWLMDHEQFYYPTGMGHAVRDCEGRYWHL